MAKILVVDDEPGMRRILNVNLRRDSHVVVESAGASEAIELIKREDFDVVLTDQKMPDGSGLDVVQAVREDDPTASVIILTAVGTVELAVESMRRGAFDFLTKPFDPDVVRASVLRASERTALLRENAALKTTVRKLEGADEICGSGAAICSIREFIARVAPISTTVLITGETARDPESLSFLLTAPRSPRPFWKVSSSVMSAGPLPELTDQGPAFLRRRTKAPCSWTKLRRCRQQHRRSFCVFWLTERSSESGRQQPVESMCAFLQPHTAISKSGLRKERSVRIFTIDSPLFRFILLH
jgi:CheY-like chemotaxis protein